MSGGSYVFASHGGLLRSAAYSPTLCKMRLIYVDIQHNYVEMLHTFSRSRVNIIILHIDIIYLSCTLT